MTRCRTVRNQIAELVRVGRKRIMLSVSSRPGVLHIFPICCRRISLFSFRKAFCDEVLNKGLMGGEQEIAEFEGGGAPWPITYTFLPDEL